MIECILVICEKLARTKLSISSNWNLFIKPVIYAHLCNMDRFQWKKDFFQWVIDKKYVSIVDIDKNALQEKWPSILPSKLIDCIMFFTNNHGTRGVPLYKNIYDSDRLYVYITLRPLTFEQ